MALLQAGTLSTKSWTVNSVTTPWSTKASASSLAYASGGFSFTYSATTTKGRTPSNNIAETGFTDTIQGGSSSPLALVPSVPGIALGPNTILDLGPAATSAGNQLLGYGANCGVRIGQQTNPFSYGITSGAVLGG
ncbi:MAG: hypothetical protein NTY67_00985, partial [Cyanobacteria bacterium]|nr:hypothetical protein [Cyanobacteriota bacterium]